MKNGSAVADGDSRGLNGLEILPSRLPERRLRRRRCFLGRRRLAIRRSFGVQDLVVYLSSTAPQCGELEASERPTCMREVAHVHARKGERRPLLKYVRVCTMYCPQPLAAIEASAVTED